MGKDNTILMVGVGVLAALVLMPKKEGETGGDGGGGINLPGFPGWGSLIEIPTFPGWGGLIPDIEVPDLPKIPAFPGWKNLIPDLPDIPGIPDLPDIPGIPEVPGIPSKDDILGWIKEAIKGVIPEEFPFPLPPGKKKETGTKTERDIGGKWDDFISGWQDRQTYPAFFGKTLLDHLTSWFAPVVGATVTPYAEGVEGGSEQPTRSEFNYPSYEARPSRDSVVIPEIARRDPVNLAQRDKRYTAFKGGKKVTMDLSSAMKFGGGT